MTGRQDPVVLIQRYTTFTANPLPYLTLPLDVRAYSGANLVGWRGMLHGTGAGVVLAFQESNDRDIWTECDGSAGGDPGPNDEKSYAIEFSMRWFRVHITCNGTNAMTTCWLQGFLTRREK
jgi:hypothetical protein